MRAAVVSRRAVIVARRRREHRGERNDASSAEPASRPAPMPVKKGRASRRAHPLFVFLKSRTLRAIVRSYPSSTHRDPPAHSDLRGGEARARRPPLSPRRPLRPRPRADASARRAASTASGGAAVRRAFGKRHLLTRPRAAVSTEESGRRHSSARSLSRAMGGWRADGSSSAPPHGAAARARGGEGAALRSERSGGARRDLSTRWADAMRPVKDAAALGRNGADALRDAVLRFFADIEARGVPSTVDLDTRACASDVLTLVRAANGCAETPRSEDDDVDSGALRRGVDALVADLVAADALALDAEVVAVLCAYYVSRLEAARAARDPAGASSSSTSSGAAPAFPAVAALARTAGPRFPDAETGLGGADRRSACVSRGPRRPSRRRRRRRRVPRARSRRAHRGRRRGPRPLDEPAPGSGRPSAGPVPPGP